MKKSQKHGNESYIALNPKMIFRSKGKKIEIIKDKKVVRNSDPFNELRKIFKTKFKRNVLPLFYSGGIGYFAYDCINKAKKDDLSMPDIYLIFPKDVIYFDHVNKFIKIISQDKDSLNNLVQKIKNKANLKKITSHSKVTFTSNFNKRDYIKAIKKCIKYVHEGDSFQIKISQRFECTIEEDPFLIYQKLKKINPSPYAAYIDFDDIKLVSCSPEHLIKVEKNHLQTRPIGGTYPISSKIKDFKKDVKENAEHNMLIDLERNDLGRVAKFGTVKVNEKKSIEKYSHLIHLVTNIEAKLNQSKDVFDVFKSMFPGGTITGCPKKRTMEIISEIEPCARGLYSGSIGFINFSNEMDLNLIIRTWKYMVKLKRRINN